MAKAKYELEDGVALITLSDPATLNAISVEMTDELTVLFNRASEEARCIVLTGEGRGFSSGANLASGAAPLDADGQPDLGARLELAAGAAIFVGARESSQAGAGPPQAA